MARRPGLFVVLALMVCLLAGTGFARFSVDAGAGLLVGQRSDSRQVYDRFSNKFGADPIVVGFAARDPRALYRETNLARLARLETDLAGDPAVASVLGPGTVAQSLQRAANVEVNQVESEYPTFVGEFAVAVAIAQANQQHRPQPSAQDLQTTFTTLQRAGGAALAGAVVKATVVAQNARADYEKAHPAATLSLRDEERAAQDAVATQVKADGLPQLFAQYLAGPNGTPDEAAAAAVFTRLTAAVGTCSTQIADALRQSQSCQVFFEHILLDLPSCAAPGQGFCPPKTQWASVLPQPSGSL